MARRSRYVASDRRVLCMRRCTRTTSKQLAERWAKGRAHIPSLPTGRAMSQLDNDGELSRLSQSLNWGLVNLAQIDG